MDDTHRPRGTVVLIHGIFNTGRIFGPMTRHLEKRGFRAFAPSLKPRTGAAPLEAYAEQAATHIAEATAAAPDAPLYLVGFSMGGLICRLYLQNMGGLAHVRRFAAISAPMRGSRWANVLPLAACRQMRPNSDLIQTLNADITSLARIPVLTLWTPLDLAIRPPSSSLIPVGVQERVIFPLHSLMPCHPRVIAAVANFFEADTAARPLENLRNARG